jgi:hypothetical protein
MIWWFITECKKKQIVLKDILKKFPSLFAFTQEGGRAKQSPGESKRQCIYANAALIFYSPDLRCAESPSASGKEGKTIYKQSPPFD